MNAASRLTAGIMACLFMALSLPTRAQETVTLEQAVKNGTVKVEVAGLGGSTGDSLLLTLQRQEPRRIRISLAAGTVFKCANGAVQNMVASRIKGEQVSETAYRPAATIELSDDARHAYIVEAYCMDFHKDNPGPANAFSLGTADPDSARILAAGLSAGSDIKVIQAALWIARDHVSDGELKQRFPVSAEEMQQAHALLRKSAAPARDAR